MIRTILTDGSGKWFDADKAISFDEDTWHDGSNFISCATGSQWDHERMYCTRGGTWVLNSWSNYQNVREQYTEVDLDDAVMWLCANRCCGGSDFESLPQSVRDAVAETLNELEV
jgi:hypothetical protein